MTRVLRHAAVASPVRRAPDLRVHAAARATIPGSPRRDQGVHPGAAEVRPGESGMRLRSPRRVAGSAWRDRVGWAGRLAGVAVTLLFLGALFLSGCAANRPAPVETAVPDTNWTAMADSAYEAGRVARAAVFYREAARRGEQTAVSWFNFGNCMARLDRSAEAATGYRRATEIAPAFLRAHQNLAALLQRDGDMVGAARHYEAAARLDPRDANSRYRLGELAQKAGDLPEASWWFEQARLADPLSEAATSGAVQVQLLAGDTSQAAWELERFLSEGGPERVWTRLLEGDLASRRGLRDQAAFAWEDAAASDSGETRAWARVARLLASRRREAEAATMLDLGDAESGAPAAARAALRVLAGRLRMEDGDLIGAVSEFRSALELGDPGGAEGLSDLVDGCRRQGDRGCVERAEQALRLR